MLCNGLFQLVFGPQPLSIRPIFRAQSRLNLTLSSIPQWKRHAEAGEAVANESEDVMGRAHVLLQAAKADDLASALGERSVEEYLGSVWLSTHPAVMPAVRAFAAGVAHGANFGETTK